MRGQATERGGVKRREGGGCGRKGGGTCSFWAACSCMRDSVRLWKPDERAVFEGPTLPSGPRSPSISRLSSPSEARAARKSMLKRPSENSQTRQAFSRLACAAPWSPRPQCTSPTLCSPTPTKEWSGPSTSSYMATDLRKDSTKW